METKVLSVSELNEYVKRGLEKDPLLQNVAVEGEISNFKRQYNGHCYFSLKDAEAAVNCAMFHPLASRLLFKPENGMKVLVFGKATVYPRSGNYQLVVSSMSASGAGDLHAAFEQLKKKLSEEGLFDPACKKPIPRFPNEIAVITSGSGAAVMDILRILRKRWPLAKVKVMSVRVQGEEAVPEIVGAIRYANRYHVADLIICGRGGGSLEDLWCFNDERLARAIFQSEIPVISAVGHEPDVTIADYVADLRAATPSNAAELATPDRDGLLQDLDDISARLDSLMDNRVRKETERLARLKESRMLMNPALMVEDRVSRLQYLYTRLLSAQEREVSGKEKKFFALTAALDAMSPLKVLGRGYAVARKNSGEILSSVSDAAVGEQITVRVKDGRLACTVDSIVAGGIADGKEEL